MLREISVETLLEVLKNIRFLKPQIRLKFQCCASSEAIVGDAV